MGQDSLADKLSGGGSPRTAAKSRTSGVFSSLFIECPRRGALAYGELVGYPFEDLDDSQFERLVVQCSRKLFGIGVVSFASGVDGGRDARFTGVAELYPSDVGPWEGKTVIQAKHTNSTNTHVSDPSFSGTSSSSVISEEIPRVKKLAENGDLDNYVLFTNRRLGANADASVREWIAVEAGLGDRPVAIHGTEYLDDLIRQFPEVLQLAQIDPVDSPLNVSSFDIAEVILAISDGLDDDDEAPIVDRVSFERKNELNAMSEPFANELLKRYLSYTVQFDRFLASPANADSLVKYNSAVEDFQLKVIAKRHDYQSFDDVFNYLVELLFGRDVILSRNRRLTRAMVFYMYWNCDLGATDDVVAE